ncbi:beta-galactosidase extracellular [Aspergillus pseudoustus]|uniref:Beta-galactosidase n=1 Tax=Aspergillus pseudoustus TaxID=1810923 RepID=A0ABR4KFP6_9EURO
MLISLGALFGLAAQVGARHIPSSLNSLSLIEYPRLDSRSSANDIVTWDSHSLIINGERVMIFSGEMHPFRLPVPGLWADIFQKIKALGLNTVSFYTHWALMEGKPGDYRADGIFDLEPFFKAAQQAGVYLIARPGPYINAESSGGGFPGWLARVDGEPRTTEGDFLNATNIYMSSLCESFAKAQITNGGPIILFQPENEYLGTDGEYMQYIIDQARSAGIVVPFLNNEIGPNGKNAPGTGVGEVDIYGHDGYPLGFDCSSPNTWKSGKLPVDWHTKHMQQSPSTPYAIAEFQAGAYDSWGGYGFDECAKLVNHEFERVFYKNNFAFGVKIFNLYMAYGGTNWGNIAWPGGYSSYDYAAPIRETRELTREKYSELKLIGNFAKVSHDYLVAVPENLTTSTYTNTPDLAVTCLRGQNGTGSFYVVRHDDYSSLNSTRYRLKLPTTSGVIDIPQIEGKELTLNGRDSKIHVVDYDVGGTRIEYSTAEVFTWQEFGDKKVLILYGGAGEYHEISLRASGKASILEGPLSGATLRRQADKIIIGWQTSERRIVEVDGLQIFLLDRNSAYNYWVPSLSTGQKQNTQSIIVNGGYLVRNASLEGPNLLISADFNRTTQLEVIGAPPSAKNLFVNGQRIRYKADNNGIWTSKIKYKAPKIDIPDVTRLKWKYLDTLPEIGSSYDDSTWTDADQPTQNQDYPIQTPTSLYGADYGYHTGYLLYRGHFNATGNETSFTVTTRGGNAFGSSVWLNSTYIGSWIGSANEGSHKSTYSLPELITGQAYVLTVVVDNMGLDEQWGGYSVKNPRGITSYELSGRKAAEISWKITGNFGGEDYVDKVRGPLNEGGLFAERHGFHQPSPPVKPWKTSSPLEGFSSAGIGFYTASFDLDIPVGWDIPLSFKFESGTGNKGYRVQLYVNGYQFGKYVSTLGPQTVYPVPEGVLNYRGKNWLAVTLWAQDEGGAKLDGLGLVQSTPILTGMNAIEPVAQPKFEPREGVY